VKIRDEGNVAVVIEATNDEVKGLKKLLSVKSEGARYSKAYRAKKWDGYFRLYNVRNKTFPAGLIDLVRKKHKSLIVETVEDHKCEIDMERVHSFKGNKPRSYQLDAVSNAFKSRRGILELPTGAGKTFILAMMAAVVKGKVLVVVPSKSLLTQTVEVLKEKLGERIGVVGAGECTIERVTVGIYKSVAMLEDYDLDVSLLLVDECHHASADTYNAICSRSKAYYRFGLSADALDQHNVQAEKKFKRAKIIGALGPILHLTKNKELKEGGYLAEATITFLPVEDPYADLPPDELSYDEAYCKYLCENNNLALKVKAVCDKNKDAQILVIVKHIHHGEALHELIPNALFLHGELPKREIDEGIADFNDGFAKVLIGSPIFNEGVDVPQVDILINAAGDVAATKQRLGRGLRAKMGKENKVHVYDFILSDNAHLARHVRKRTKIYIHEGHTVILPKEN